MEYLSDWRFVVGAICSSFIIGMSRGGFAGGIAFVGVLIMAQLVPTAVAAAFILPLLCFIDPFGNYVYRKHVHWPSVKVLLPGGLLGMAIGASIFYIINDNIIRLLVAGLSFYMIADRILLRRNYANARTYSAPVGFLLGTMTGISTFLIHAGNPPVSAYLLPQKMSRFLFIGTCAVLFTLFNYLKLAPYAWLGLLDWSLLAESAVFFPVCLLGFVVGKWLAPRMSDRIFYMIMYVSIFLLGLKLGIEGILELL